MDFMTAIDVGASALKAERTHLNVISMNLANAKTTKTVDGGPYRRKEVIFKEDLEKIFGDRPFQKPEHPSGNGHTNGSGPASPVKTEEPTSSGQAS